jgi:hypothetical protein
MFDQNNTIIKWAISEDSAHFCFGLENDFSWKLTNSFQTIRVHKLQEVRVSTQF